MLKAQRIAILVDSENLEISVSENYEAESKLRKSHIAYPDWTTIIPRVIGGRTLVRNIYYKKKELRISKKFEKLWTDTLAGEIKQPQKSVDPYIIVDAITLSEKVDVVVLLAGDKDYLPLVWYLKSRGCKVEFAAFPDAFAATIRTAADRIYTLGEKDTIVLESSRASKWN